MEDMVWFWRSKGFRKGVLLFGGGWEGIRFWVYLLMDGDGRSVFVMRIVYGVCCLMGGCCEGGWFGLVVFMILMFVNLFFDYLLFVVFDL